MKKWVENRVGVLGKEVEIEGEERVERVEFGWVEKMFMEEGMYKEKELEEGDWMDGGWEEMEEGVRG